MVTTYTTSVTKKVQNMQKLITLIVAGLIIYVVMSEKFANLYRDHPATSMQQGASQMPSSQTAETPMEGNFLEKSLSKMLVNILKTDEGKTFFENLIQPTNMPLGAGGVSFKMDNSQMVNGIFRIKTEGIRKDGPASCGHIVTAHYQITTLSNTLVEDTTKTFNLGGNDVMIGLSDIIVGMYEGETREGVVMPQYAIGAKDPKVAYKVKVALQSIMPKVIIDPAIVKVFDDEIAYKRPYLCGERAIFDVKVSKCSGEVVYDSQKLDHKINMILGDLAYPMIFSHGLFAKVPVGTRTIIAQGKYFRSLAIANTNKIFQKEQLPEDEYFLIEFKNFEEDGRSLSSVATQELEEMKNVPAQIAPAPEHLMPNK